MGKKKSSQKLNIVDDDDWERALADSTVISPTDEPAATVITDTSAASTPATATAEPEPEPEPEHVDAAAAFLASQGMAPKGAKDKKKKVKKKKTSGSKPEPEEKQPSSAAARMIQQRLKAELEEKEKLEALQKAEFDRVAELNRAEAEKEKDANELAEKKRLAKQEKKDKQKAAGTYLTKGQKAKLAAQEARLASMAKMGMIPTTTSDNNNSNNSNNSNNNNSNSNNNNYNKKKQAKKQTEATPPPPPETEIIPEPEPDPEEEEVADDWDASSAEGDDAALDKLDAKLDAVNDTWDDENSDEEDEIEKEKKKETLRLKKLGQEREKREQEEAIRLAAMEEAADADERRKNMVEILKKEGRARREKREAENLTKRTRDKLRAPIIVIMGHVDTGKTSLLDKIRKTNVQDGEAGGITQQIGATYFTPKTIAKQITKVENYKLDLPGLIVIDTPGHESFTNLRTRGSNLCDLAILVVDMMHGLEPQTIESLNMLKKNGTPFVIALNKCDRCYQWKSTPNGAIRESLKGQPEGTIQEFNQRTIDTKTQLQEQGVNSNLYWDMGADDWKSTDFVPIVPTSAVSGEGIADILLLLCKMGQVKIWESLQWHANLQATTLEVKAIDGLGTTVDVCLVNGTLREGDKVVLCTMDGPVVTEIRGLLTPPPEREMRVKADYIHHKSIDGAIGVKIIGHHLEKVMAGTPVLVVGPEDEEEDIKAEVMSDLSLLQNAIETDKNGVMVHASTLGALEALLQFLRVETKPPIPVSHIGIGTISKKHVTTISTMAEKGKEEYATILAFDVKVEKAATEQAEELGVKIMTADIIYHLFDQFTRYLENLAEKRRAEAQNIAVFPAIVKILPQHIFNKKDPIIVGMEVVEGILKVGTPLCVPALGGLNIGIVTSIEMSGKEQQTARKGASVAVKIVNEHNPTIAYGRQFDSTNMLYSTMTRASIDALKLNFKDALETSDWKLVVKLKKIFNII